MRIYRYQNSLPVVQICNKNIEIFIIIIIIIYVYYSLTACYSCKYLIICGDSKIKISIVIK